MQSGKAVAPASLNGWLRANSLNDTAIILPNSSLLVSSLLISNLLYQLQELLKEEQL